MRQPERKETLPDDSGFFCQLNACPGREPQAVPEGPAFIEMTGADENQIDDRKGRGKRSGDAIIFSGRANVLPCR